MSNLMVSLAALFGMAQSLNVAELPAPEPAKSVEAPAADQRAALEALVRDTSGGRASVSNGRYFEVGHGVPWMSIVKRIDSVAREKKAQRLTLPGADPGKRLVEIWQTGEHKGVAAAMVSGGGGGATLAYYDVELT